MNDRVNDVPNGPDQPAKPVNPLQNVVERQDEQIKQFKEQLAAKDKEIKKLLNDVSTLGSTSERYRIASLFLFFIFLLSIAVIANRQWELSSTIERARDCTAKVLDLVKNVGRCGEEELTALKNCRLEVKNLTELKGRYEESQKGQNSTALIKQADDLMGRLKEAGDLAAKQAEGKDDCHKHLNKVQAEVRQFAVNMTELILEKEDFKRKYEKCGEQLAECQS